MNDRKTALSTGVPFDMYAMIETQNDNNPI
jgi:hypothetical protein